MRPPILLGHVLLALCISTAVRGETLRSADAYVRTEGTRWTLGTSGAERVIALTDGKLTLRSLRNKASGRDLVGHPDEAGLFSIGAGPAAPRVTASGGGWSLAGSRATRLRQGEIELDVTLRRRGLEAIKRFVVYPQSTVVREWTTFRNVGAKPLLVSEPSFLDLCVRPSSPGGDADFHWMTGGENQTGSWVLKTERLPSDKPRVFDSYDPFPLPPDAHPYPGDGIDAKILLNEQQVWPASGWQYVANANVTASADLHLDVRPGDRLVFLVNMHGGITNDTTAFDPTIAYDDGETHVASKEFSGEQGRAGWRYGYFENGKFVDLVYYPAVRQWRKRPDNATGTPFVDSGRQHPDVGQDAARIWTAPKAGRIHVSATVCNIGNQGGVGSYGFHMGCSSYAPWNAVYSPSTRDGLFLGWDYFGHWASAFTRRPDGSTAVQLRVAGYRHALTHGESVTTPKAFTGLYRDDLDNAGNECLDWQYRYLWDYTREPWFPAIRMLGYWYRGTVWGAPEGAWTGGKPDWPSTFRKVFRVADLMRSVGADVYHRDWGWWDRAGDWNGPDFRTTGQYLGKHGMGQLIYAFLYTVDPQSQVARRHPDWLLGGGTLDMSRPEVVAFMQGQLDSFAARWGRFEWRNDSTPTSPNGADDTPLLGQDAGFRAVLQGFLDRHPGCAFQAVNGGGNNASYDYARFASSVSFSDGAVGIIRNYWASLLLPPDKTSDIPDIWQPGEYDKAKWRGLLCINFDMTGDTWDPDKIEGIRQLIDIYHYLHKQGVVGRWVRVYRPIVAGDDPTMYFERLSRDGRRGIIIPKHTAHDSVTLRPKGLLGSERYVVSFQESGRRELRTGADLMRRGIVISKMAPGELVYLNLPLHPGSKLDTIAPAPPSAVVKRAAVDMGYPGVEIAWKPGRDNNWVSYYDVLRDGAVIDRVAHGAFYFDHSAGADPGAAYEVRTVDGASNVSARVPAGRVGAQASSRKPTQGAALRASARRSRYRVLDDAPGSAIRYSGAWEHVSGIHPAYGGTLSRSDRAGAAAEATFSGRSLLLFGALGPNNGKAAVRVDGGPAEVVDTFSADDIWGVCVWRKDLPTGGEHVVRIEVLGEHNPRSMGTLVQLDAFQVRSQ